MTINTTGAARTHLHTTRVATARSARHTAPPAPAAHASVGRQGGRGTLPLGAVGAAADGCAGSLGRPRLASRVLDKLEEIEVRLRAMEAANRRRWLWDSVMCCAGPQR